MKKSRKILIAVVAIVVVLLLLALAGFHFGNSQSMVLSRAGFDTEADILLIDRGLDENGAEYQVVQGFDPDQNIKLAYLTKGALGAWSVDRVSEDSEDPSELDVFTWTRPLRTVEIEDPTGYDRIFAKYEVHRLVYGNDAVQEIQFPSTVSVNADTAVNVWQNGSLYLLHFTKAAESPDELHPLSINWMLKDYLGRLQ